MEEAKDTGEPQGQIQPGSTADQEQLSNCGNWSVFCSTCGKGFINQCRLKKHCTNVHERSNRFPCPICDKGFTSDAYRLHHMEMVHNSNNPYACVACQENFSTRAALMNHVAHVHQGADDGREAKAKYNDSPDNTLPSNITPDSLPAQFSTSPTPPTLADEQPLDLSLPKPQLSPLDCTRESTYHAEFTESQQQNFAEVSSTSLGPMLNSADTKMGDGDDSNQSRDLRTGGRHRCTYCEKSFASKEYLRIHEATIHEGTKAFICSACGKHFSVHQALRKHYIIQHEGGKPYRCRDCKMEFRTRATLRSHRFTAHGQTPACKV
ncbi:unnamed protein product [Calicophoron daubneyi]|uniref:C2H2-type domain-containing protein n=1 Tax=Calicophoron daubneyi TaxID=300641 RepID=A0AAV2TXE7_CALDB